jgi:hypothetical protein
MASDDFLSAEPDGQGGCGGSMGLWYSFELDAQSFIDVRDAALSVSVKDVALFEGCDEPELVCGDTYRGLCADSLAPGRYWARVSSAVDDPEAEHAFEIVRSDPPQQPNDACGSAAPLEAGTPVRGSFHGAADAFATPSCGTRAGPDLTYALSISQPSDVEFDIVASDVVVSVYDAACGLSPAELFCGQRFGNSVFSDVPAGDYLVVLSHDRPPPPNTCPTSELDFSLTVTVTPQ